MKTKFTIVALILVASIRAQKLTKILGLDTTKFSKNGVMYKSPGNRMEIEGVYNGKDLFIKNSFGKAGIGFCISGVKVNGNFTTDEINAPMFRINLGLHKLKANDKIKIIIYYNDSCAQTEPLMMNAGVIKQKEAPGINGMVMEGKNWNQTLLIVNPRSGKNYGIKEVLVNGKKVDSINSDVFEVNFYKMGIKYEEKIKIEFKYEDGCEPFVINPEAINY